MIENNLIIDKCFCGSPVNEKADNDGRYRCSTCKHNTLWIEYKNKIIKYIGYLIGNGDSNCSNKLIIMEISSSGTYRLTCNDGLNERYDDVKECYDRMKKYIKNYYLM